MRSRVIDYVESTQEDFRNHYALRDRNGATAMDDYQFLLRMVAHSERHYKQAEEVKTNPRYPRR